MIKYYTFLEYSKIYSNEGVNVCCDVRSFIKGLDFVFACKVLSIFGFYEKKHDRDLIAHFLINRGVQKEFFSEKNSHIISRHSVLLAWKYLLKYHQLCISPYKDELTQIENIIKMLLVINEKNLKEKISDDSTEFHDFLSANAYFNYYDNSAQMAARSYYMFVKNKNNQSEVNINEWNLFFKSRYSTSIERYIYLVYLINTYIEKRNENRTVEINTLILDDWFINPRTIPGVSALTKRELRKLLDEISFSLEEGSSWSTNYCDKVGNFALLTNKPLIKINNNCYVPIERKCLNELLFYSLFQKISNCEGIESKKFFVDFGKVFEEYIDYICWDICKKSLDYYVPISEFKFKSSKLSPDFMILNKNNADTILVIESKSSRILYNVNNYLTLNKSKYDKSKEKHTLNH